MKLKEILFDHKIKDQFHKMNSKFYLGIYGKKGSERKMVLQNEDEFVLESRYFLSGSNPEPIYAKAIKLLKEYDVEKGELPSGFLEKFFSSK